MHIKLTYPESEFVLRQTSGSSGIWEDCTFSTSEQDDKYDGWVVYERLEKSHDAWCDLGRTIFITGEPSGVRRYNHRFLAQFAAVIGPQERIRHPQVFRQQPAIPWWVGVSVNYQPSKQTSSWRLDYDKLSQWQFEHKAKKISIICSNKDHTDGHRKRLSLLYRLMDHFGEKIDVYGHGFQPISDKWDAICPYRYHIVLENSSEDHYWSEKLADAFLAASFPIYYGCKNLSEYFPSDSFCYIDRDDHANTIKTISNLLDSDCFENSQSAIARSRNLILNEYNVFPTIVNIMRKLVPKGNKKLMIRPESYYSESWIRATKRRLRRMLSRYTSSALTS